jgi:phosphoesterase RecJ-like protein
MNEQIKKQIFEKIKQYDTILLFRHVRPDGDCMGATKGMKALITATWPHKQVYLLGGSDSSDYLAFMGPEDPEQSDEVYARALGIVLDTASENRIANPRYKLCKELIKLDHHIPVEQYGNFQWVEEHRSSCCEMVVDFYRTFAQEMVLSTEAAEALYTGMVTDSGRFKYEGVSGETLRCAAVLLDRGVNTERLYANLYLEDYESLKFKSFVYEHMGRTPNGVAYIFVDKDTRQKFGLTLEQASAVVGDLDGIRGCIAWLAFIETDTEIRVRLRSRFVHINTVAEKYRGGGHANASGATLLGREEIEALLADADALVKDYKENHEGWL